MTAQELIALLSKQDPLLEVVINMTTEEGEGFWLCPLAKVEDIQTDAGENLIMLTGLEYHATTELASN